MVLKYLLDFFPSTETVYNFEQTVRIFGEVAG